MSLYLRKIYIICICWILLKWHWIVHGEESFLGDCITWIRSHDVPSRNSFHDVSILGDISQMDMIGVIVTQGIQQRRTVLKHFGPYFLICWVERILQGKCKLIEQAYQWHQIYCHDLEVVSSNPGWVELGVYGTSVIKFALEPKISSCREWFASTLDLIFWYVGLREFCKENVS